MSDYAAVFCTASAVRTISQLPRLDVFRPFKAFLTSNAQLRRELVWVPKFHSILFKSGNVAHTHTHPDTKNKNTTVKPRNKIYRIHNMQEKAAHKTLLLYTQVCYDTVFYISKELHSALCWMVQKVGKPNCRNISETLLYLWKLKNIFKHLIYADLSLLTTVAFTCLHNAMS